MTTWALILAFMVDPDGPRHVASFKDKASCEYAQGQFVDAVNARWPAEDYKYIFCVSIKDTP